MAEMNEAPGAANRFRATVVVDFAKLAGQGAIRIVLAQALDCFDALAMTTIAVHGFSQLHA
jgi:hypothetical protein